ncbi:delta-aminolevulinic acid dehydratase [Planctomycetota bacterium]
MDLVGVHKCVEELCCYIEGNDYAGYDPYDALNSETLKRLTRKSKWARIAITQMVRRLPINIRPVLGIRKGWNAKGVGLFLWGYAKLYTLEGKACYLDRIDYLLNLLESMLCPGYSGNCWGYNFDWQSRTFYRPKGTPTVVNTSFVGHALLDCHKLTGKQQALDLALPIKDFLMKDLHRTVVGHTFCFSYTPLDTSIVHNANLLGASLLARLASYAGDSHLIDTMLGSLRYSMQYQHKNGAWFYAETDVQRWIDSFHTGFNLQAIRYVLQSGFAPEYAAAYERGVQYYAKTFFQKDGRPKYYNTSTYPLDIHAPAQAISFFSGEGACYRPLTARIVAWMINNLYSGTGYFYYRKGRFITNQIPYIRWAQAWAFHALTEYLMHCQGGHEYGGTGTETIGGHGDTRDSVGLLHASH